MRSSGSLAYLSGQREIYYGSGTPLTTRQKESLRPFFAPNFDGVRTVQSHWWRLPPPRP